MRRALVTGITGQDGRHLSQFLAKKGYQVFGLVHGQANPKIELVQSENPALELLEGDLRDLSSLIAVVEQVQPDEVYNLGAISFVHPNWQAEVEPGRQNRKVALARPAKARDCMLEVPMSS